MVAMDYEVPALDDLRAARLDAVQTLADLDDAVRELLLDLIDYTLGTRMVATSSRSAH